MTPRKLRPAVNLHVVIPRVCATCQYGSYEGEGDETDFHCARPGGYQLIHDEDLDWTDSRRNNRDPYEHVCDLYKRDERYSWYKPGDHENNEYENHDW